MRRSVLKLLCIVSGILFLTLSATIIFSVVHTLNTFADTGSIGIIGGADAPTFTVLLQKMAQTPIFFAAIASLFSFIGTGLALIFCKGPKGPVNASGGAR